MLTPEFRLLAGCCRWPQDEIAAATVSRLSRDRIDWPSFLTVVQRHRVWGLAANALRQAATPLPVGVEQRLHAAAVRTAQRGLLAASETVRVQAMFRERGIASLGLKGPAIALRAFGDLALRFSKDIDVLVDRRSVGAAIAALEATGYVRVDPPGDTSASGVAAWLRHARDFQFLNTASGVQLELHWRLFDNRGLLAGFPANAKRISVDVPSVGEIETVNDLNHFVYLCVHGGNHGWSRLKWLADIGALLATFSEAELVRVNVIAKRWGVDRCVTLATSLCGQVLDNRSRLAITARSPVLGWMNRASIRALTSRPDPTEMLRAQPGLQISHFFLRRGSLHKLHEIRAKFVSLGDVQQVPMPRWLDFSYPILRLPLWAIRRVKRARKRQLSSNPKRIVSSADRK